eukprot:SAG31_NODE_1333_length_8743_cov_1.681050_3_plen_88_part_00
MYFEVVNLVNLDTVVDLPVPDSGIDVSDRPMDSCNHVNSSTDTMAQRRHRREQTTLDGGAYAGAIGHVEPRERNADVCLVGGGRGIG